ncbi:MAG: UDP-glucose 4-epimerase GalE [Bdellovibrionaceae bacterium]|nr:UDP-glucose 4-epimerase GalE [Pseudobdellovibrionaceae bacterium]
MNILVTGGAGYIGSHATQQLLDQNHKVIVLDNLSTGHRWAISKKAEFVEGNISDIPLVTATLKKFSIEAVMHFAAHIEVEESVRNPIKYFENNTASTLRLFKACSDANVKKIIFSSTAAIYGNATSKDPICETAALHPVNPYGWSKLLVETALDRIQMSFTSSGEPLKYVALRYFNVAGASNNLKIGPAHPNGTHLIKVACQAATGQREGLKIYGTDYNTKDGTCVRDYIHVDDLVHAHILALDYLNNNNNPSVVLNCGYGRGYSVKEVLDVFQQATGTKLNIELAPRRPGDPEQLIADPSNIKAILNWTPKYNDLSIICKSAFEWEKRLLEIKKNN